MPKIEKMTVRQCNLDGRVYYKPTIPDISQVEGAKRLMETFWGPNHEKLILTGLDLYSRGETALADVICVTIMHRFDHLQLNQMTEAIKLIRSNFDQYEKRTQ